MSQLAADLKAREHALAMEQSALKNNTRQVLKLTNSRLYVIGPSESLLTEPRLVA